MEEAVLRSTVLEISSGPEALFELVGGEETVNFILGTRDTGAGGSWRSEV